MAQLTCGRPDPAACWMKEGKTGRKQHSIKPFVIVALARHTWAARVAGRDRAG